MKRLLFVLTFMSLTFPVIWGQTKIQKYAGRPCPILIGQTRPLLFGMV